MADREMGQVRFSLYFDSIRYNYKVAMIASISERVIYDAIGGAMICRIWKLDTRDQKLDTRKKGPPGKRVGDRKVMLS